MMGGHHAATGAAAWVAVSSGAPYTLGLYEVSPLGVVAGSIVCAGAALLPDADHHNATIAHSLPPVSNVICSGVGAVSGGHRHGTHSLVGIAAAVLIAFGAGLLTWESPVGELAVGAGVFSLLLVAFAAKALKLTRGGGKLGPWLLAAALSAFIMFAAPSEFTWLPVAVGLGAAIHIAGDMLTTGGVPLLWPWVPKPPKAWAATPVLNRCWQPNGYMGVPVLGNAGSMREWVFLIPVTLYAVYGVVSAIASGVGMADGVVAEAITRLIEGRPA
ncbi:metal-dependent hydrolase [Isoptericola croceus]|uniref:metal-dependent hydrolase n=1 Tax=Isoptericola croceus TaxID=3031406 RepID=UPI0023F6F710|nr:metal-dependent hydrolase [Isoptericola croceus]